MTLDQPVDASMPFSDENADGDYKEAASKKLPKTEQWRIMAENGDIRGLLQEAAHAGGAQILMDPLCEYVHDAIEKLARDDPAAFAAFLQSDILAGAGVMVVRAHYLLDKALRRQHSEFEFWTDRDGFNDLAQAAMALDVEAAKLLHISASTQLLLERARKLRQANDKAEAKKNRPRQPRRRRMSPRPQPMTANSRLGGDLP